MWYKNIAGRFFGLPTLSVTFLSKISKSIHVCQSYSKPKVARFETRCSWRSLRLHAGQLCVLHVMALAAAKTSVAARFDDKNGVYGKQIIKVL